MTSIISDDELKELYKFKNIIIWGYPLHTHTHSYIHYCWVKTFKFLNCVTYWFDDDNFQKDLDYNNSLFITEGYVDKNIPILESCTYFVHMCINPLKYLNIGARLIDIRFNINEINDININFKLDDGSHNIELLSEFTKYELITSDKHMGFVNENKKIKNTNYEAIYLYWATDLLPHEFDYSKITINRENIIYYVGSSVTNNCNIFIKEAQKHRIKFVHINPWKNPISFEENRQLIEKSFLAPDFRPSSTQKDIDMYGIKNGKNHIENGYVPCRVFKNISYGQLGITDSLNVKKLFGEHVEYSSDISELFDKSLKNIINYDKIKNAMDYVKNNHTYLHRVRDLLRAIMKKKPINISKVYDCTFVTALYDINREYSDGITINHYIEWMKKTLLLNTPLVIYLGTNNNTYIKELINNIRNTIYYPTEIIETRIDEMPMYWMYDKVNEILHNEKFIKQMKYPNDITNKNSLYTVLQHSKFDWVLNAYNSLKWKTKTIGWIDIGMSKFFDNMTKINYDLINLNQIYDNDLFLMQKATRFDTIDINKFDFDTYIGTNEAYMVGTVWITNFECLKIIKQKVYSVINDLMLDKNIIDNEQITLFIIYKNNPELFSFIELNKNTKKMFNDLFV